MPFQTTFPLDWGMKKQDDFSVSRQKSTVVSDGILRPHWQDCFELLYMLDGSRDMTVENENFILQTGDILVVPPHLTHFSSGGLYEHIVFGYAESVIYTPDNSYAGLKYLIPFHGAPAKLLSGNQEVLDTLRELILQGMALYKGDSPVRMLEIHACILKIHAILWQIYSGSTQTAEKNIQYLSEAQEYIEAHLTEDISPYDIAEALHLSHSHLCRIIKSALHITPAALINRYRLCLAEKLLTNPDELSVTEVALRSGFRDCSYFIRCFRLEKGMTPGEFRKDHKA